MQIPLWYFPVGTLWTSLKRRFQGRGTGKQCGSCLLFVLVFEVGGGVLPCTIVEGCQSICRTRVFLSKLVVRLEESVIRSILLPSFRFLRNFASQRGAEWWYDRSKEKGAIHTVQNCPALMLIEEWVYIWLIRLRRAYLWRWAWFLFSAFLFSFGDLYVHTLTD